MLRLFRETNGVDLRRICTVVLKSFMARERIRNVGTMLRIALETNTEHRAATFIQLAWRRFTSREAQKDELFRLICTSSSTFELFHMNTALSIGRSRRHPAPASREFAASRRRANTVDAENVAIKEVTATYYYSLLTTHYILVTTYYLLLTSYYLLLTTDN